jgi:hypothetical protein
MYQVNHPPVMPLEELERRYRSLGKIEELDGERTFLGRCNTFAGFLEYGPVLADYLRSREPTPDIRQRLHALGVIALEAWPALPEANE